MSKNSENILEANHVLSTENNTVKDTKTNNANTSDGNTKSAPKNNRNKSDQNKNVAAIVGDSIIKYIYGWELSNKVEKVVVKDFSGLTTKDMKHSNMTLTE